MKYSMPPEVSLAPIQNGIHPMPGKKNLHVVMDLVKSVITTSLLCNIHLGPEHLPVIFNLLLNDYRSLPLTFSI